jgi:hypothetical protein
MTGVTKGSPVAKLADERHVHAEIIAVMCAGVHATWPAQSLVLLVLTNGAHGVRRHESKRDSWRVLSPHIVPPQHAPCSSEHA